MAHLVLGLGNPGAEYAATRHNVGFRVVEELARRRGRPFDRAECNSRVAVETAEGDALRLLLAQPQTYMNRSGYAARCLLEVHQLEPAAVLVVYDEINLPLGKLRLRTAGSPAGHRGMESVIENLRTDQVARLRLGVAPESGPPAGEGLVDFVLSPFTAGEEETVAAMIVRAADACDTWLREGAEAAMNRFN
jgi:PTH1 family peptidyl-tRNA hydrolase